ncbi:hypothetical protein P875_00021554 [Aspergillus parasiticus SU-1]|uniref:Ubiquitin 3 binding protein But2 C-terminal domain-containing protein n=3 Tax=Aspergillus subgen. Circumdati TaxID=2720871 RepID=A0A5N6ERM7_9EURO|nr:hypothetical protein BDV33DRAFT_173124 [Aspergillus novoparasiticus]KJK66298.1 hypothetical protein P875_00021554 [Aspergillus parasiticus SU-1]
MKISAAISTALLAVSAAAFDKNQPWGKRDYNCVNVFQGIPDNSTVAPGAEINIKFNRNSKNCESLTQYKGADYSIYLYNNPVRNLDTIHFDKELFIKRDIPEQDGAVTITIPSQEELGTVADDSVWYLRLSTSLNDAPQMPTLFNAAGPFAIRA